MGIKCKGITRALSVPLTGSTACYPRQPIIRMFRTIAEALAAKAALHAQGGAA